MPSKRGGKGRKSPSSRQRKYVEGVIGGKTKRAAAIDAGYTASTAENAKQKIEKSPSVQKLFDQALERAEITLDLLAQRIRAGLDAIQTKYFVVGGELLRKDVTDFAERRAAVELSLKLLGLMRADRHEVQVTLEELLTESWGNTTATPEVKS